MILQALVEYYEGGQAAQFTSSAIAILVESLSDTSDVVAVHALRALGGKLELPDGSSVLSRVGHERLAYWCLQKWINVPEELETALTLNIVLGLIYGHLARLQRMGDA